MFTRRDVWDLEQPWHPILLNYARAVQRLRQRKISERPSWWFIAGMHGFNHDAWSGLPEPWRPGGIPTDVNVDPLWNQCQHGSWYFLPWHRSYLLMFEAIIRDAISDLDGAASWALPYWNYNGGEHKNRVPEAFAQAEWPGDGINPLYVPDRAQAMNPQRLSVRALDDPDFEGSHKGGTTGIAGPRTSFSHAGGEPGKLEEDPHFTVHALLTGFMPSTDIAALDPIFWLHHANVDRLWEVWLNRPNAKNRNSADTAWLDGPVDKPFKFIRNNGAVYVSTPRDVANIETLGYRYDNTDYPLETDSRLAVRFHALGVDSVPWGLHPADPQDTELLGSNDKPLTIGQHEVHAVAILSAEPVSRWKNSYGKIAFGREPDRVYANLQRITGTNDAGVFEVFAGLDGVNEHSLGLIAMFGVAASTRAGEGLTKVLDVTAFFDMLKRAEIVPSRLNIRITWVAGAAEAPDLNLEQITVFRQPIGAASM